MLKKLVLNMEQAPEDKGLDVTANEGIKNESGLVDRQSFDKNASESNYNSKEADLEKKSDIKLGEENVQQPVADKDVEDSKDKEETEASGDTPDEYSYTKREGFTSEIYKISITNIPKNFGFGEFKKKLQQLELKPVKMKQWKDIVFVTFRSEEERAEAIQKVNGYKFRGRELQAVPAKPAADPLMRKRKWDLERKDESSSEKKNKTEESDLTPEERLKNSVTPLWKMSYDEQLKTKQDDMRKFLKRYLQQLEKNCPDLRDWLRERRQKYGHIPMDLQDILPSSSTEKYRNKCEFTIGPGVNGEKSVVGFRFGTYSKGTVFVGSPDEVALLPDAMKKVVKSFQNYINSSQYVGFNPEDHTGNWRQLAIRTSRLGHVMAMVDFHPQDLSEEAVAKEIGSIKSYFTDGEGATCGITSCYFRSHREKMTGAATDSPYNLVFGEKHITENLLDMKFQISPNAFFQVNTAGAEILYQKVCEWCGASKDTTVLDVCCGTGTIGLSVAKSVKKVIGVEMCSQAIDDAKVNAELNGISNVTYHCAKAEDVMSNITRSVVSAGDVVAIVDPPRGGLHSTVVVALRNCRSIKRLVYVSCNVNGALNNLIDLVRPTSKRLKGPRFYPVKAIPVDLFPHTPHCELVLLLERQEPDQVT